MVVRKSVRSKIKPISNKQPKSKNKPNRLTDLGRFTLSSGLVNQKNFAESGTVTSIGDGIATVYGLSMVRSGEMVTFCVGVKGMVLSLKKRSVSVVLFADDRSVQQGDIVTRDSVLLGVSVGKCMLGRVVDALGNPIDNDQKIISTD